MKRQLLDDDTKQLYISLSVALVCGLTAVCHHPCHLNLFLNLLFPEKKNKFVICDLYVYQINKH